MIKIDGWILSAKREKSNIKLFILDSNNTLKTFNIRLQPIIYLTPKNLSLNDLVNLLERQDFIYKVWIDTWRIPPWYTVEKEIVVVKLFDLEDLNHFINAIRAKNIANIWNTVLTQEQIFMVENNLRFSTLMSMEFDNGSIRIINMEDDLINTKEVSVKRMFISPINWFGINYNPFYVSPEYIKVHFGVGYEIFKEKYKVNDVELNDLCDLVIDFDPDIIESYNLNIIKWLIMHDNVKNVIKIRDRIFIYYNSIFKRDDFPGIIDLSKLSYLPINIVSRSTIGKILTSIEAIEAFKRKFLIPEVCVFLENSKCIRDILILDRGGLYLSPKAGIYWNVAQCDYTSLYPSIIAKFNISPETVNALDSEYLIEGTRHLVCFNREGLIPKVLSNIIKYRILLKDRFKETNDSVYKSRYECLKWVLVASFGYLGYRNSKFGKIEAYECVTALARNIMNKTIDIAKSLNLKILHVLVDSIWLSNGNQEVYSDFCKKATDIIGIRLELDKMYKWIVFIPNNKRELLGIANKYFGVTINDNLIIKGLEAVRRDYPEIVRETQLKALKILSKAKNMNELKDYVDKAIKVYLSVAEKILDGNVDPEKLIIAKRVNKNWWMYRTKSPAIYAAKLIKAKHGEIVRYIVYGNRGIPVEKGFFGYDPIYYKNMLIRSIKPILYVKNCLDIS